MNWQYQIFLFACFSAFVLSASPTQSPTSLRPTVAPSQLPSVQPSASKQPSVVPSRLPSVQPSASKQPSVSPTRSPTKQPTANPTLAPTTLAPTQAPSSYSTTSPLTFSDPWQDFTPTPPDFDMFIFKICQSFTWDLSNKCLEINLNNYQPETIYTLPSWLNTPTPYQSVVYKLPPGYVVTILDTIQKERTDADSEYYTFMNQLRVANSFDVIGSGKVRVKSLTFAGLGRLAPAAFAFYQYNPLLGFAELFSGKDGTGFRLVLYPSLVPVNQTQTFWVKSGVWWFFNDRAQSIRLVNLDPTVSMRLYKGGMSSVGLGFDGATPFDTTSPIKAISLDKFAGGFVNNNQPYGTFSSFAWQFKPPITATAQPVNIPPASYSASAKSIFRTVYVTNPVNVSTVVTISLAQSWVKQTSATILSSTTDVTSFGFQMHTEGGFDIFGLEATVGFTEKLDVSTTKTNEQSRTLSSTETVEIDESHQVTINNAGRFAITLYKELFEVAPTKFTFNVQRTYDFWVPSSYFDGSTWTRSESIDVIASGNILGKSSISIQQL